MTLTEFKLKVKEILKEQIGDTKYINKLDTNIKKTYEDAKELEDLLGYGTPDPYGYALGIVMLYPNLP